MNSLWIDNIGELVLVPPGPVPGSRMRDVLVLQSAAMLVENGLIAWFGSRSDRPPPAGAKRIDAAGGCVTPGLIDCHTHTVFAGTREKEFVQKVEGKSYREIAESGGGIRVTVEAVRRATPEELIELARPRLQRMLANGVTTVEIKSGYGLTVLDELKMLRVARLLSHRTRMEIVGTYLAAHTLPKEFPGRPDDYLDMVLDAKVLETIRKEGLAEFCDVFCEATAFDLERSERVLQTGKAHGLTPRMHADQITQMGASRLAARIEAASADHLETIDDGGIQAMKEAGVIAVLLPACSFFLGIHQAPARKLLAADLPVAIATDYNPGSSMVESLPLTLTIAVTQMRMTPTEALVAATANAAAVLGRQGRLGAIAVGMQADLVMLDVPNLTRWLYEPGRNCVRGVIKKGEWVAGQTP